MGPREVNLLAFTQLGRGGVKVQTVPESLESPKPVGGKIASPNSCGDRNGRGGTMLWAELQMPH